MNIKDLIKDNTVYFVRYRANTAYYGIDFEGIKYTFPVPIEDIGGATLEAADKAIYYMRYIRKAIDNSSLI